MKKIFIVLIAVIAGSALYSQEKKIVGFDIGICSGIPFYGSSYVTDSNDSVTSGDFSRIIIGSDADISFRIASPIKLLIGADLLCDFIWSGKDHSNHFDYAFWSGVKIYPGFAGLNASLAYALGCRTDFIDNDVEDSVVKSSSWGNGFRIALEYDFQHDSSYKCLPSIGTYYRMMPRGNDDYDNILAVYVNMVF